MNKVTRIAAVLLCLLLTAGKCSDTRSGSGTSAESDSGTVAVPGTPCGNLAAPETAVPFQLPVAYAPRPTIHVLTVHAKAIGGPDLKICVRYSVDSEVTMALLGGLAQLNKVPVQAQTPYKHPINFYEGVTFVLKVTVAYIGNNPRDVGVRLQCWTDVDGWDDPVADVKITSKNFLDGKARATCEHIED